MNDAQAVEMLKDVIRINSTYGNEKEVADYLAKVLKEHGIDSQQVEYSPGRNQLIAEIGEDDSKKLGFTGHMDVVPVGEIAWEHDPFSAEEVDGLIYGRGSSDMKSGLVAEIVAMIRLNEAGLPKKGKVKLLATVGEETSAIGAEQLVDKKLANDLDALIIAEPTAFKVTVAHQGAFWLRITTFGRTAHGSMPKMGINAVEHMIKFLGAFQDTFDFTVNVDELIGTGSSSIDVIHGGNGTNVIPDKCTVEIDIRTVPTQDHQDILKDVQALMDKVAADTPNFKGEIEVINDLGSMKTEKDDPFVQLAYAEAKKYVPEIPEPRGMTGYTDGSRFMKADKKYPMIVLGPGDLEQAHQPNEHVRKDRFLQSIEMFENIAKEFLN